MKRSLLVMAVLLTAFMGAKAQEDSVTWMAEAYCADLGLAADDTAFALWQEIDLGYCTFTAWGSKPWLYKPSDVDPFEYNGVSYTCSQVQGQVNGTPGKPIYKDVDTSSCAVFTTTAPGRLDIAMKISCKKNWWIIAIPTDELEWTNLNDSAELSPFKYEYAEDQYYWGGFFDITATYYEAETPVSDINIYNGTTINLGVDTTYIAFFSGSKIMLAGMTFVKTEAAVDPGTGISLNAIETDPIAVEYYNAIGQRFAQPQLGELNIVIETYADGSRQAKKLFYRK